MTDGPDEPANALLLSEDIKGYFDSYELVVVPVNPEEKPLTRWKIDILDKDIEDETVQGRNLTPGGREAVRIQDLQDREVEFLNDNRPVAGLLHLHFLTALIRLKNTNTASWKDAREKYFPHASSSIRVTQL
ncbi:hypothetical protein BDP55DRAFT_633183 [Colletotrichum godetiae]|uniref:HNH nuclease domain-containing protein n=1 Tax=Colletotrichum godetiae TaxID=1209918 RepID=A0AAJ0AI83_9PEZI|nr:uncharacterized protein BDP55DRAFT_633183 [Colletotrichum godetiae]KAK1674370.1 hypothetical protein BDP55DRAFT_633183 [Colletotrichum godetiae]